MNQTLVILLVLVAALALSARGLESADQQWPVPYKRYTSRPPSNPYCKALYPFCPNGSADGSTPVLGEDDVIDVLALKAPVWDFKFGDLLGKFDIYHDAVGFHSHKTGKNFTTEWYELFQLFNCTFPHLVEGRSTPLWCNQGAACFFNFIDYHHWSQYGNVTEITQISGSQFNQLMKWIHEDNHTGIYYNTFRIRNSTDASNYIEWFSPYDCANYLFRMYNQLAKLGAKFEDIQIHYTFFTLISDMPVLLGNDSSIFGPKGNLTLAATLKNFYEKFQTHIPWWEYILHAIEAGWEIFEDDDFYYYFNSEYWFIPMKKPFIRIDYDLVPFPRL